MKKHLLYLSAYTGIFIILDLASKIYIQKFTTGEIEIIKNFFYLKFVKNPGIAFSINIPFFLIIIMNILLIIFLLYIAIKDLNLQKKSTQIFLALILGGGLGNLIDRIFNGYVVDFIAIGKYPTFNLADIFITIGVFSLFLFYGKITRYKKQK